MRKIIYSALTTPDGTLLESRSVHDFRTYVDKNGKTYMIDGGLDYVRSSANGDEKFVVLHNDEPIEIIREHFTWGRNYDENNKSLPKTEWIKLKNIKDDHLQALIEYPKGVSEDSKILFIKEKQYRMLELVDVITEKEKEILSFIHK